MAIVLLEWAVEAWKNSVCQCKSWNSSLVSAQLKVENKFFHKHVFYMYYQCVRDLQCGRRGR